MGIIRAVPRTFMANPALASQPSSKTSALDLVRSRPRARALQHIRQRIQTGEWESGAVLPSTLQLAQELEVNWQTVNHALDMLSDEGLIRSNGGRLRIVNGAPREVVNPVPSRVMSSTVVMLSRYPASASPGEMRESGHLHDIVRGAFGCVSQLGLNQLTLHLDWLKNHGVSPLVEADRPCGVVLADLVDSEDQMARWALELWHRGVPVVAFNDDPKVAGFDQVSTDHAAGAFKLTRFLLERNFKRPLMVWSQGAAKHWGIQRQAGYQRALTEAGVEALPVLEWPCGRWMQGETFDRECYAHEVRTLAGYLAPHLLGKGGVDAILALNDVEFSLVASACRILGREPGRDIAIVGYDNMWHDLPQREIEPAIPLATIDKHNLEIGRQLVVLLSERIAEKLPVEPQRHVVEPELIIPEQI